MQRAKAVEDAVAEAAEHGEVIETERDGEKLLQRPLTITPTRPRRRNTPGKRVRVYHKRETSVWLSDGSILGPKEEADILLVDAENPAIKPHLIRVAT